MKQIKATNVSLLEILAALVSGLPLQFYILLPLKTNYKEQEQISLQKKIFISYLDYISNFDSREQKKNQNIFDLFLLSQRDEEGPDEPIRVRGGEGRRHREERREGISGMAGDPQCVRGPGAL